MKLFFYERAGEIALSLVVFAISLICFSFVTDDYASFMSSLAARQFSDFAYFDVHFQGYIGIREVYRLLYHLVPALNWHFAFCIISEFIGLFLLLHSLNKIVLYKIQNRYLVWGIQLLFVLCFIENIIFISHTRISLTFCGIALFNLGFTKDLDARTIIRNGALFIFGLLLRPESSMGTLLLVGAGYMIYNFSPIGLIKRFWLPVSAIAIFLGVFTIDLAYTDLYIRKVEPEIEYKMMAKRVVDIGEMKTAKDSVKYEAALVGMWFDMKEMSPEFMRGIILAGSDFSFNHALAVLHHVKEFYSYYIFIYYIVFALLLLCILFLPDAVVKILKILLFEGCTFMIIYALDYNGFLVSNRHFLSLQLISLLILCFYFFDAPSFKDLKHKNIISITVFLFLLPGIFLVVHRYKRENQLAIEKVIDRERTMNEFERRYTGQIVAITIDARFLFDQQFLITNKPYTKNTYIMFDWFTFPLTPRYTDYLSRICDCDGKDPVAFFTWLNQKKALYMSVPFRYDLTERYMRIVHGYPVKFTNPVLLQSLAGMDNVETANCEVRTISLVTD